jgi:hypothetical protein
MKKRQTRRNYKMLKSENKAEKYEDPVERQNPGLVYSETDPTDPQILANKQFTRIIKTYLLVDISSLNLIRRLIDMGYTDSVDRFCRDALNEKLARAVKDHKTLGNLLSDKLCSESGYTDNRKGTSYDEKIDFHISRKYGLEEEERGRREEV